MGSLLVLYILCDMEQIYSDMYLPLYIMSEWVMSLSHVWLFVSPWTVARQAPLSVGFSRQEYWSGLPFPSPGDLPNTGIKPGSTILQADALTSEPPGKAPGYWMGPLHYTE